MARLDSILDVPQVLKKSQLLLAGQSKTVDNWRTRGEGIKDLAQPFRVRFFSGKMSLFECLAICSPPERPTSVAMTPPVGWVKRALLAPTHQ